MHDRSLTPASAVSHNAPDELLSVGPADGNRVLRRYVVAGIVVCVVLLLAAVFLSRLARGTFTISGQSTAAMSSGRMAPLDLTFTNTGNRSISITDVLVTIRNVSPVSVSAARSCTIGDFAVQQLAAGVQITVPAKESRSLSGLHIPPAEWPHVGQSRAAGNRVSCTGVMPMLHFAASRHVSIL
jgi:hypothetical protein